MRVGLVVVAFVDIIFSLVRTLGIIADQKTVRKGVILFVVSRTGDSDHGVQMWRNVRNVRDFPDIKSFLLAKPYRVCWR